MPDRGPNGPPVPAGQDGRTAVRPYTRLLLL